MNGTLAEELDRERCKLMELQGEKDEADWKIANLTEALTEARAALRWIDSNTDVPPDFPNMLTRLYQVHGRAGEALRDTQAAAAAVGLIHREATT
jgi:hypothetical protein